MKNIYDYLGALAVAAIAAAFWYSLGTPAVLKWVFITSAAVITIFMVSGGHFQLVGDIVCLSILKFFVNILWVFASLLCLSLWFLAYLQERWNGDNEATALEKLRSGEKNRK